jgi:hypothetical protein
MLCERCGEETSEVFSHAGMKLCEDCFIELHSVPKTCDPLSVRSARITRKATGQSGLEGLLPVQRDIYLFLKEKGKATRPEVAQKFNLSPQELEKHCAVLRHCELVRGYKDGAAVYLTTMQ